MQRSHCRHSPVRIILYANQLEIRFVETKGSRVRAMRNAVAIDNTSYRTVDKN
jgi:hypothetical protein